MSCDDLTNGEYMVDLDEFARGIRKRAESDQVQPPKKTPRELEIERLHEQDLRRVDEIIAHADQVLSHPNQQATGDPIIDLYRERLQKQNSTIGETDAPNQTNDDLIDLYRENMRRQRKPNGAL